MAHEIIVFLNHFPADEFFHKGKAEYLGEAESQPGTDGQANGGIEGAQDNAVNVATDKAGDLTGNWCDQHLENLKTDKNDNRKGTEGIEETNNLCTIGKEAAKVIIPEKKNTGSNDQEKNNQLQDDFSVHSLSFFRVLLT
jgi:hypothetical protein